MDVCKCPHIMHPVSTGAVPWCSARTFWVIFARNKAVVISWSHFWLLWHVSCVCGVSHLFACSQLNGFGHSLNLEKTMTPNPTSGTNCFSDKSCPIFIKLSGYLPNHLPTWSKMSRMTPSFKSPVRNPQHPQNPQLMIPQPNHFRSW